MTTSAIPCKVRERGLTLFSTGKFPSRRAALDAAVEEKAREEAKKQKPADNVYVSIAGDDTEWQNTD